MAGSRAHERLQLLVAILLALVCLVHGQLESRPPPLDKNGQPLSREKRQKLRTRRKFRQERKALYKLKHCKRVNGRRVSVVDGFDFKTLTQWAPKQCRAMTAMRDVVALQLPEVGGEGLMIKTGITMYSFRVNPEVVRIFGYIQDETTEEIERHENATFTMYLNETSQNLQGVVRLYDRMFNYKTDAGALSVTELPLEEGMCDIPSSLAGKTGGKKKKGRQGSGNKNGHTHDHGEDSAIEARHHHRQLRHKHHLEHVARVLEAGKSPRPFLIFVNFDVSEGPHPQWGDVTDLVKCDESFTTPERIQSIVDEVREDYAPFDVEVTADREVYDAWQYNRVKANVINKVVLSGKLMSCGVAFMNTYSQVDNNVWASCDCGGPGATAGTISHEVGHTFGLRHDGDVTRPAGKTTREYLFSLPKYDKNPEWPKSRRWNSIMGGSIETGVRQWNAGTYPDASNPAQDDVDMLRTTIGERPGLMCNQVFPMRDLSDGETFTFPQTAIICAEGMDSYYVRVSSGPCMIEVMTPKESNLKFRLRISALDEDVEITKSVVSEVESNPYVSPITELKAKIPTAGPYLITIQSIAQEASDASNGFSFPVYGSMGFYALTVHPSGLIAPSITEGPHDPYHDEASAPGAQSCYTSPALGLATLFGSSDETPESMDVSDGEPKVVGSRFRVSVAGEVRAVRFFKSPNEGGSGHVGKIYDWDTQELLASTEDASSGAVIDDSACPGPGWVTIDLPTPLAVEPGREYIVAMDCLTYYVKTENYVASSQSYELEMVEGGGKFGYEGSIPITSMGSSYFVDVVMSPSDYVPSDPVDSLSAVPYVPLTDVVCNAFPATGFQTIFGPSDEPQENDIRVELETRLVLGLRFQTVRPGYITAVRFYKAMSEAGWGHQGRIYDWASGELLATTVDDVDDFECAAPGWVSIPLKVPFYTAAGTEYVVALDGVEYYAKSSDALTDSYTSGDLMVIGQGSLYGQTQGEMPMESWLGASNYWIDVEFTMDLSQALQPYSSETVASSITIATSTSTQTKKTKAPTKKAPKKTVKPVAKPTRKPTKAPNKKKTNNKKATKKVAASSKKVPAAASQSVPLTAAKAPTKQNTKKTKKTKKKTAKKVAASSKPVTSKADKGAKCNSWPSASTGVQTLFKRTEVPDVLEANQGAPMVLGLRVTPAAAGQIRAVRFYKPKAESGYGHVGKIYDRRDGRLLGSTTELEDSTCEGPCWVSLPFQKPVPVEAKVPYVVALDNVYYYAKTEDYFTSPVVKGKLSTKKGAGVFGYTPGEMPQEPQPAATNYWVDVEYKPASSKVTRGKRRQLLARR